VRCARGACRAHLLRKARLARGAHISHVTHITHVACLARGAHSSHVTHITHVARMTHVARLARGAPGARGARPRDNPHPSLRRGRLDVPSFRAGRGRAVVAVDAFVAGGCAGQGGGFAPEARWWASRGVRLRQDEVVALLVADALDSPSSRFAGLGVARSGVGGRQG